MWFRVPTLFFCLWVSSCFSAICWKIIGSPESVLTYFCTSIMHRCIIYFFILNLMLIYLSVLVPIPHSIDYWNFVVSFCTLWKVLVFEFCSFSNYSGYLSLPCEVYTKFWKVSGSWTGDQIESMKWFWKQKCQSGKRKGIYLNSKCEMGSR